MADIEGKTNVASSIAPFSDEDTYPTHEDEYGKGGFRVVSDITERDNIPQDRRKELMLVAVKSGVGGSAELYQLQGGLTNEDWEQKEFGAGSDLAQQLAALERELDEEVVKPTGLDIKDNGDGTYELSFSYSTNQEISHFVIEKKNPDTGEWEPYDGGTGRVDA
jgi:hypothetical protein